MASTNQETQENKESVKSEMTYTEMASSGNGGGNGTQMEPELQRAGSTFGSERCQAGGINMERKDVVILCHFLIVFVCVASYFGYELSQYFNDRTNRKEYTLDDSVEKMPLPFVYLDHYAAYNLSVNGSYTESGNVSCDLYVDYYDASGSNDSVYFDSWSSGVSLDGSTTINEILNNRTTSNWLLAEHYLWGYGQFLLIPPDDLYVTVESKSKLFVGLYCPDYLQLDDYLYYVMDNRQQLNNFDTFREAMRDFYFTSEYVYSEYELQYTYEWFTHDNEIDSEVEYDYYVTTVESTFAISDSNYKLEFQISPNTAGKKTTFVTARALDFWGIFSLTGGMFTTINSIVAVIAVYLIWGFDFKIIKFEGIAHNSDPSSIEKRKFHAYMKRYTQKYVDKKLESRDKEIAELKATIAKIEANTITLDDFN